ncbi:hypothetical protein CMI46_00640 [Candidatus Pacearchaeota archaeon]|nr:hypothetical protein [Candidatus Pacearchaeota archaeon]|tara:strand:+ start:331 stop:585 length:255 start_codon:yes stop_codon:yes gene_type:complete
MVWQDTIIAILTFLFGYALIPQVYQGFKNKQGIIVIQTGFISFVGLYILAFVYLTLNLYFAAAMVLFTGTLWYLLLFQKILYRK